MKSLGCIFIILSGIMWGTISVFVNVLDIYGFTSFQYIFIRSLITALLFGIVCIIKNKINIKIKDIWIFAGAGIVSFAFFNLCYFKAIRVINASAAAILLYTAPIFVLLFSSIIFKEKITLKKIVCVLSVFVGCALVSGGSPNFSFAGLIAGLGAGIGYSLYSIFGKFASDKYSTETTLFYTFLCSSLFTLFTSNPKEMVSIIALDKSALLWLVLMAVITTALPYFLYTFGLKYVSPSVASVTASIEPVMATFVGTFILKEQSTPVMFIGIFIILISIIILNYKKTSAK